MSSKRVHSGVGNHATITCTLHGDFIHPFAHMITVTQYMYVLSIQLYSFDYVNYVQLFMLIMFTCLC